jgi:hypothetical protein
VDCPKVNGVESAFVVLTPKVGADDLEKRLLESDELVAVLLLPNWKDD